ncbi:type II secretion system protein [Bdellovibrio svalbardensis]|uniref:Uncharacterized protein n=1 Tax=Bdellovibrio svalbardensis TaxID=2972972 RepID=A0ABT6DEQ6_9BACT|nr:hypothetical protein [Bdellovibrio svalbardensis]MDG0815325.1 hypothetical protein [Bdellovibrio svalbardensis]
MAFYFIQRRKNQQGFSTLEGLVAAGILAIVVSAWLVTSSVIAQKKVALEQLSETQTAVVSLRDLLSVSPSCLSSFQNAPLLNPSSLPNSASFKLSESYVGALAKNKSVLIRDLMKVTTLKNGRHLLYGELQMKDLSDNKNYFVGPLFLEVNSAGTTQSCYAELSSKDRCLRQDGLYLDGTGQCQLPQYACANGQFMVSAGVQKWVCK